MRKPGFCLCENKGADQLQGSLSAPLFSRGCKAGFVSETPKIGFLTSWFNFKKTSFREHLRTNEAITTESNERFLCLSYCQFFIFCGFL